MLGPKWIVSMGGFFFPVSLSPPPNSTEPSEVNVRWLLFTSSGWHFRLKSEKKRNYYFLCNEHRYKKAKSYILSDKYLYISFIELTVRTFITIKSYEPMWRTQLFFLIFKFMNNRIIIITFVWHVVNALPSHQVSIDPTLSVIVNGICFQCANDYDNARQCIIYCHLYIQFLANLNWVIHKINDSSLKL